MQTHVDFGAVTCHDNGVPYIASIGDWKSCQVQHGIAIERQVYNAGEKSFAKAVLLFLATFYAFNIDYRMISNTMNFILKKFMQIDGCNVPFRVKTLLRELAK